MEEESGEGGVWGLKGGGGRGRLAVCIHQPVKPARSCSPESSTTFCYSRGVKLWPADQNLAVVSFYLAHAAAADDCWSC